MNTFSRNDTKAVKGIAVVMMLFHHLVRFPERWPIGFRGFPDTPNLVVHQLAFGAQLCVPIFFFLGGYGLYERRKSGNFDLTGAICTLYKQYWKVFVIFIPIAFIFFSRRGDNINELCKLYVTGSDSAFVTRCLSDFIGYSSNLNREWWFFGAYLCALPLGCLFDRWIQKHDSFIGDMFAVFVIDILLRNIFPAFANAYTFYDLNKNFFYAHFLEISNEASAFFAGIVFAKYDGLAAFKDRLTASSLRNTKNIGDHPFIALKTAFFAIIAMAAILWCRSFLTGETVDALYTPFFVIAVSILINCFETLQKAALFLGRHSTNIWLIHTFYCYYFLEFTKIVYCTRNMFLDLLILLALSLASSIFIEKFFQFAVGRK